MYVWWGWGGVVSMELCDSSSVTSDYKHITYKALNGCKTKYIYFQLLWLLKLIFDVQPDWKDHCDLVKSPSWTLSPLKGKYWCDLCTCSSLSWKKPTRCCGPRRRRRRGSAKPKLRAASSCSSWRPTCASCRTNAACWSAASWVWRRNASACRLR